MKQQQSLLFILILFFLNPCLYSQNKGIGIIEYKNLFQEINGSFSHHISKLSFNDSISLEVSHQQDMSSKTSEKVMSKEGQFAVIPNIYDEKGTQYYRNLNRKEFLFRYKESKPFKNPTVTENWVDINWKLLDEYKVIQGYRVQKAAGAFRGRDYNVWFTKEIPFSFGPWKLHGTPGMILEVEQKQTNMHIVADKICYPCDNKISIEKPQESENISINDYVYRWDNRNILRLLELKKQGITGLTLRKEYVPTEKSILQNRSKKSEILYEWENSQTKRSFQDKEAIESILTPDSLIRENSRDLQFPDIRNSPRN